MLWGVKWREFLPFASDLVTLIWAAIALAVAVVGLLRLRRARRKAAREAHESAPEQEAPLAGLTARPVMRAQGFKDREAELARLGDMMAQGNGVVWVTGPTQAGKSWLLSRYMLDNGLARRAGRFELRHGHRLLDVLEGINSFLCRQGENGFGAACGNPNLADVDRLGPLVHVLSRGKWVIILDSYEQVADSPELRKLVEVMQQDLVGSTVFVGSRVMPEWGDREAEIEVRAIEEQAGKELVREAGAPAEAADDLYRAVGGLPGALKLAGALAQERGASEVARDVKGAAGDVGEKLLAETFEAASEGARKVWAGLCLLPAPVTREAARAMCALDGFDEAWAELVRRKLLEPGAERAELHPLARAIGEARLGDMGAWPRACGKRGAAFYSEFAEKKGHDRLAVEPELENLLAAARLAFQYAEWKALWRMGIALGEALDRAGRWAARDELLRLSYEGAGRAANRGARARFSHNLAIALQQRGDVEGAERLCRESLAIAREMGDRPGEAKTLHQLGIVAETRGDLQEAERLYRESLGIEREVADRPGEGATLHQLGTVAHTRGDLQEAERLYRESLRIERKVGDRPGEADTLHQLGIVAQIGGDLQEAERLYGESLRIKREVGDRPGEAKTLHQLGTVARISGDVQEAQRLYQESLGIERQVGDRQGEAMTLHGLGILAQRSGDVQEAQRLYRESLGIEREVGDRPGEARTLAQLALLAEDQGDLPLALQRMEKAAAMFEEMGLAERGKAKEDLERLRRRLAGEPG